MQINENILKLYAAPQSMLDEFAEKSTGSINFIDLLNIGISQGLAHFIVRYCKLDQKEFTAYDEFCKIYYSDHVFDSSNITNSTFVNKSENIKNSSYISNCSDIIKCRYITSSTNINDSENVVNSFNILNSERIINSENVETSTQVSSSKKIIESTRILNSSIVTNSSYIVGSGNIFGSSFILFSDNLINCLFTIGQKDQKYLIFNEPVSAAQYFETFQRLQYQLETEWVDMIKINDNSVHYADRLSIDNNMFDMFQSFSPKFWEWVKSIPNYNAQIAEIFCPKI